MVRESLSPSTTGSRELDELRTIQLLEETVGPKSLRQLRHAVADEAYRRVLESVSRGALEDLRELDDLVHEWARHEAPQAPRVPIEPHALDPEDVLTSIVELKESESELLRRAAEKAPSEELRVRLLDLAARQESHAEKLKSLL